MVWTHLKTISQNGNLPQIGLKIKNIWKHHLVNWWIGARRFGIRIVVPLSTNPFHLSGIQGIQTTNPTGQVTICWANQKTILSKKRPGNLLGNLPKLWIFQGIGGQKSKSILKKVAFPQDQCFGVMVLYTTINIFSRKSILLSRSD